LANTVSAGDTLIPHTTILKIPILDTDADTCDDLILATISSWWLYPAIHQLIAL